MLICLWYTTYINIITSSIWGFWGPWLGSESEQSVVIWGVPCSHLGGDIFSPRKNLNLEICFWHFFCLAWIFVVLKSAQVSFHISFLSRCENVITDMSQVRLLLLSVAVFLLHQCKKKGCLGDIRFFAERMEVSGESWSEPKSHLIILLRGSRIGWTGWLSDLVVLGAL